MLRREGEVFFFGTAMIVSSEGAGEWAYLAKFSHRGNSNRTGKVHCKSRGRRPKAAKGGQEAGGHHDFPLSRSLRSKRRDSAANGLASSGGAVSGSTAASWLR